MSNPSEIVESLAPTPPAVDGRPTAAVNFVSPAPVLAPPGESNIAFPPGVTPPPQPDTKVRDRIIREAMRVFGGKGYSGASLREIAEAAGVTKPMLYYYFGPKDVLVREILDELDKQWLATTREILASKASLRDRLTDLLAHVFASFTTDATVTKFVTMMMHDPTVPITPEDRARFDEARHAVLRETIEAGKLTGEVRPDANVDAFVTVLHAVMVGTLMEHLDERCAPPTNLLSHENLAAAVDILFNGIGARPKTD